MLRRDRIRADSATKTPKTIAAKGSAGSIGSAAVLLLSHAFFLVTLIMRQALMKKRTQDVIDLTAGALGLTSLYVGVLADFR
jgi:hypothetical protein